MMLFEGAVLQGPHPQRPIVAGPRAGSASRVWRYPALRHVTIPPAVVVGAG
jgi:hypothetical protein